MENLCRKYALKASLDPFLILLSIVSCRNTYAFPEKKVKLVKLGESFPNTSGCLLCELPISFVAVKRLPIMENQILVCPLIMSSKTLIFAQIVLNFVQVQLYL